MPQIKIHVSNTIEDLIKGKLVLGINDAMSKYGQINGSTLQVVLYESKYRINEYEHDHDTEFILLEILSSKKRTVDEKQCLANKLIDRVEKITKLDYENITVIYNETENIRYLGVFNRDEKENNIEINEIKEEKVVVTALEENITPSEEITVSEEVISSEEVIQDDEIIVIFDDTNTSPQEDYKNCTIEEKHQDIIMEETNECDTNTHNDISSHEFIDDKKEENKKVENTIKDNDGTFELLYQSKEGMVSITDTKILNF